MKLLVLSDLHLTPPGTLAEGLGSHTRLAAAIARIAAGHADADLLVIAGDLAEEGAPAAYKALSRALSPLKMPVALTLGTRDNRDAFAAVFGSGVLDDSGYAQSLHRLGTHQIIVLDTLARAPAGGKRRGLGPGHLDIVQLGWLDQQLGHGPSIIVMHHPAVSVGPAFDTRSLQTRAAFLDRIEGRGARMLITGHIHLPTAERRADTTHVSIAGGHTTYREDWPTGRGAMRFDTPAQRAVVLLEPDQITLHLDDYWPQEGETP